MPGTLLLATDLSCRTDRALDRAEALARHWGSRLVVVHAIASGPATATDGRPSLPDRREAALRQIRADLRDDTDIPIELVVEHGSPSSVVLDAAARTGAELVIAGIAREPTLARALLASTVESLAQRSPVPVLAVKSRPRRAYQRIVVASDFSEHARRALATALAWFPDATVELFHAYTVTFGSFVEDMSAARDAFRARAEAQARAFLDATPIPAGRDVSVVCELGDPERLLQELVAARPIDLVVTGTRGPGKLAALLIGSVARQLLASLPVDVLVVPAQDLD